MDKKKTKEDIVERPPIVVVMGHIDHGKSTLLDYIRKTNVAEKEVGGITQKLSAYEVVHKNDKGIDKKITFLDTPGHEAFSKMRTRGANIADIAILIVSAEDGVKTQTIEAWKTIIESKTPFIVAINKIDKPEANVEKTKMDLAENEIYLENYGGKIPFCEISAKTGKGVDNLLVLINILAELEGFTGNPEDDASGLVIEADLDSKRGIEATLIIKNGSLDSGMTVVVEDSICPVRIMENYQSKSIKHATFSSPVRLIGFDKMPHIGAHFKSFKKKQSAVDDAKDFQSKESEIKYDKNTEKETGKKSLPIILKADIWGSIEAIEKEVEKIQSDSAEFKIIQKGVGPVGEADIKNVTIGEDAIVLGFNVKTDKSALELALNKGVTISSFDIIYKMTDWLKEEMEKRRPKSDVIEIRGRAKIIKAFSRTRERQILGGKVIEGQIALNKVVKIIRREFEIGRGKIVNLEKGKTKTSAVDEGSEFGMMIESKIELSAGDIIESFTITQN